MATPDREEFIECCDRHFVRDPHEMAPGACCTCVNFDGDMFGANYKAKKGLDIYNKKNQRNFSLVKVCKINIGARWYGMTFLAQDDGNGERNLFRCFVDTLDDEALCCEIKYVREISLLVDHVEEYFQNVIERVQDPSSSARKDDLVDGYTAGSGVILVSPTMFRVMGEKLLSDLHKKCDDYMDPCLYEKCGEMTGVYVDSFKWVSKYAILATEVYNQKEQKNFDLIKVERLYMISEAYYCMTFWARNGKSDECRLFRALVCFKGDAEEIFKGYVKDVNEFTDSDELDAAFIQACYESDEDLTPHKWYIYLDDTFLFIIVLYLVISPRVGVSCDFVCGHNR